MSLTTTIKDCARCEGDHADLSFEALVRPMEGEPGVRAYTWTHWAPCPTNGQPILLRIQPEGHA